MRGWRLLCGVLLAVAGARGAAQEPVAEPGAELDIYVMTMGPGDAIWERFGHNALGVRNRVTGEDVVYNWGVFRFTEADFLPRFLRGDMRYSVEGYDAQATVAHYQQTNRSVWIQDLALTPAQKVALRDFVEWNALEANKFYRYDYFGDNCSTRVRDVLDRVLGGALQKQFGELPSGRSFRDEARRLTDMDFLYTGIDIGLGSPSDREMTRFEAMFIPMRFQESLREVKVAGADGIMRPIVAEEREVFRATRAADLEAPASHQLRYLIIGFALALLLWIAGSKGGAAARAALGTWSVIAGIFGMLLVGLWGFTRHVWAYENMNLLFFSPLWFLVAYLAFRKAVPAQAAKVLIAVCLAGTVAGLVFGLLRVPQAAEQIALLAALPNLAVLAQLWKRRTA